MNNVYSIERRFYIRIFSIGFIFHTYFFKISFSKYSKYLNSKKRKFLLLQAFKLKNENSIFLLNLPIHSLKSYMLQWRNKTLLGLRTMQILYLTYVYVYIN